MSIQFTNLSEREYTAELEESLVVFLRKVKLGSNPCQYQRLLAQLLQETRHEAGKLTPPVAGTGIGALTTLEVDDVNERAYEAIYSVGGSVEHDPKGWGYLVRLPESRYTHHFRDANSYDVFYLVTGYRLAVGLAFPCSEAQYQECTTL